jgi:hypothetical protein
MQTITYADDRTLIRFWLPLWCLQTLHKDMLDCAQQISTPFGSNYFTSFKK